MIRKSILIVLLLTSTAFTKDRPWQMGKVVDIQTERRTVQENTSINGQVTEDGKVNATAQTHTFTKLAYSYAIDTGTHVYLLQHGSSGPRPAFYAVMKPSKPCNLTVNGPVRYFIENDKFFLIDEDQKEHKLKVIKKILKEPSN